MQFSFFWLFSFGEVSLDLGHALLQTLRPACFVKVLEHLLFELVALEFDVDGVIVAI